MSTVEKTYIFVRKEGGGEEHVYEESGWEPSILAGNLTPYTNYRAEGGAIVDGLQATAENRVSFQTLRRNNLTATFFSCRRTGLGSETAGGWKVTYSYTSLYALSSVILHVEHEGLVTEYQGTADYNTQRLVWDIPAGDWDCCGAEYYISAKVYDIFGEFYQSAVTGIITDTFNLVNMTFDSSTNSSVTFDLDYWLDSGFASGWLDYWNENDDPDVVQPQGHFHFFDGDTQVTADGLDAGTRYLFRATIALDDGQGTEIYTAYQYASTAGTDYATVPFFVENTGSTIGWFTVTPNNSPTFTPTIYTSTDNENWTAMTVLASGPKSVRVAAGDRLYIKASTTRYNDGSSGYRFSMDTSHSIGGNLMSLISGDDFRTRTFIPSYAFAYLFYNDRTLVSAENVRLNRVAYSNTTGHTEYAFSWMFQGCTSLVSPPKTSNVEYLGTSSMFGTFSGCWSLAEPMDLTRVTRMGVEALRDCYGGCTALTVGSDVRNTANVMTRSLNAMYFNCPNLSVVYYPNTTRTDISPQWLNGCAATGTIYVPTQTVYDAIVNTSVVPSGWRVVVQS